MASHLFLKDCFHPSDQRFEGSRVPLRFPKLLQSIELIERLRLDWNCIAYRAHFLLREN